MISKIGQSTEIVGQNKLVHKIFQRGLQTIKSTSAYIGDKLYYRKWIVDEYKHTKKLSQSYNAGQPIKGSQSIIDFYA